MGAQQEGDKVPSMKIDPSVDGFMTDDRAPLSMAFKTTGNEFGRPSMLKGGGDQVAKRWIFLHRRGFPMALEKTKAGFAVGFGRSITDRNSIALEFSREAGVRTIKKESNFTERMTLDSQERNRVSLIQAQMFEFLH